MCGIAGSIGLGNKGFVDFMQKALGHRGPDGQTSWADDDVVLVQTRLAIVDVSDEGAQPFHSRDGRITVIYNGEIYNHGQLRGRHGLDAVPCDGAILPELWAKLGPSCLSELRGMFAMCVYDHLEQRVWLAVDPMGMKPLYVRSRRDGVSFSSEAMPIARFFGDTEPETLASPLFESWGCLPVGRSGIEGIERMAPGEVRVHDCSGQEISRWGIPLKSWRREPTSWRDVVDAFVESVDLHLMADVPVGLMLSQGVDSAAIAWAAAEAGRKLDCFTLDFAGSPGEGDGAAEIARSFGHSHRVLRSDPDIPEVVVDYLAHVDRPTCDGLNAFLISREIRNAGLKVALAGTGGDEILAGYSYHRRRAGLSVRWNAAAAAIAKSMLARSRIWDVGQERGGRSPLREGALNGLHGIARGALASRPSARVQAYRAHHPDYASIDADAPTLPFEELADDSSVNDFTRAEYAYYLSPMLLADADVFSMSVGLEVRLPFVDLGVVGAALQVPDRVRGKGAFVDATGDSLLASIAARPKTGFELPMARWLADLPIQVRGEGVRTPFPISQRRQTLVHWKQIVWDAWSRRLADAAVTIEDVK